MLLHMKENIKSEVIVIMIKALREKFGVLY